MKPFKKAQVDFDYAKLRKDVCDTANQIKQSAIGTDAEGMSVRNICLTVPTPSSDDWSDGAAGKSYTNNNQQTRYDLKTQFDNNANEMVNEQLYIHPINQIKGTYLEEFINSFADVYRWRISMLPPRTTLSIHKDGSPYMQTLNQSGAILDWRLHFPITTNNRCFLVNWPEQFTTPDDQGETVQLEMAHFKAGSSYLLNTSMTHCATNYSNVERIHLIASLGLESTKNFSV